MSYKSRSRLIRNPISRFTNNKACQKNYKSSGRLLGGESYLDGIFASTPFQIMSIGITDQCSTIFPSSFILKISASLVLNDFPVAFIPIISFLNVPPQFE